MFIILYLLVFLTHTEAADPPKICIYGIHYNLIVGQFDLITSINQSVPSYYIKKHSSASNTLYIYHDNGVYYIDHTLYSNYCYFKCTSSDIDSCSGLFQNCNSGNTVSEMLLETNCTEYSSNCLSKFVTYPYNTNTTLCLHNPPDSDYYYYYSYNGYYATSLEMNACFQFQGCRANYPYYKSIYSSNEEYPSLYIWHNSATFQNEEVTYCLGADINVNSDECLLSCTLTSTTNLLNCSYQWVITKDDNFGRWFNRTYLMDIKCDDPLYNTEKEFCIYGFNEDEFSTRDYLPINGQYKLNGCVNDNKKGYSQFVNEPQYLNVNQRTETGTKVYFQPVSPTINQQYPNGTTARYVITNNNSTTFQWYYAECKSLLDESSKCQSGSWAIFRWSDHSDLEYPQLSMFECCRNNVYFNTSFSIRGTSLYNTFNVNGFYKYSGCWNNEPVWITSFAKYPYVGTRKLYALYINEGNKGFYCITAELNTTMHISECYVLCLKYDIFECEEHWIYGPLSHKNASAIYMVFDELNIEDELDEYCLQINNEYNFLYNASYIRKESFCLVINDQITRYLNTSVKMNSTYQSTWKTYQLYLLPGMTFVYEGCFNDYPFWKSVEINQVYLDYTFSTAVDVTYYIFHVLDHPALICLTNNYYSEFKHINEMNINEYCYGICNQSTVYQCSSNWKLNLFGNFISMKPKNIYQGIGFQECQSTAIDCDDTRYLTTDYCVIKTDSYYESIIVLQYKVKGCYLGSPLLQQKQNKNMFIKRHDLNIVQWDLVNWPNYNSTIDDINNANIYIIGSCDQIDVMQCQFDYNYIVMLTLCDDSDYVALENSYSSWNSLYTVNTTDIGSIIGWTLFSIISLLFLYVCCFNAIKQIFKNKKIQSQSQIKIELSQHVANTAVDTTHTKTKIHKKQKSNIKSLEKQNKAKLLLSYFKEKFVCVKLIWNSKYRIYTQFAIKIMFDFYDLLTDILLAEMWLNQRFTNDMSFEGGICIIPQLYPLGISLLCISIIGFSSGITGRIVEVTNCFCFVKQSNDVDYSPKVTILQLIKIFTEDIGSITICLLSVSITNVAGNMGFYWYQSVYTSCLSICITLMRIKQKKKEKSNPRRMWFAKTLGFSVIITALCIILIRDYSFPRESGAAVILNDQCILQGDSNSVALTEYINIYDFNCTIQSSLPIRRNEHKYSRLWCRILHNIYAYECNFMVQMGTCSDIEDLCWLYVDHAKICFITLAFE